MGKALGTAKANSSKSTKEVAVRSRGRKTRQAILDMATHLLTEDGYDALVLRDVALQVGIKLGNLQYYFPTREDLLVEVTAEYFQNQTLEMESLLNSRTSAKSKLLALVDYYLKKWAQREASLYFLTIQLAMHNEKIMIAKHEIYQQFYESIEHILEDVAPDFTPLQRRQKARLITTLMDGIHMQNGYAPGDKPDGSTRFLASELRRMVLEIAGLPSK
jgi:AcrR family transcriptional regulator